MTIEEAKQEAFRRYPAGTKVKSIHNKREEYILPKAFTGDYNTFTDNGQNVWMSSSPKLNGSHDWNCQVYSDGVWAEILSGPEHYSIF